MQLVVVSTVFIIDDLTNRKLGQEVIIKFFFVVRYFNDLSRHVIERVKKQKLPRPKSNPAQTINSPDEKKMRLRERGTLPPR